MENCINIGYVELQQYWIWRVAAILDMENCSSIGYGELQQFWVWRIASILDMENCSNIGYRELQQLFPDKGNSFTSFLQENGRTFFISAGSVGGITP
jgi:hypothetical protein